MESTCPRCGASMGENQQASSFVMDMNVKGCPKCGGFLIDYGEAEEVLGKAIEHPVDVSDIKEELHPDSKKPLTGVCPYCGGSFVSSPLRFELSQNTLHLDQCTKCQGIWFDKGELSQIFEYAMKEAMKAGELDEESIEGLARSTEKIHCPRCAKETDFHKGEIMGMHFAKCSVCKGMWLNAGELDTFFGEVHPEHKDGEEGTAKPASYRDMPATGGCPNCKIELVRWTNLPPELKDMYIDFCPKCMGIWFDKGELKTLFTIFSQSPFLANA